MPGHKEEQNAGKPNENKRKGEKSGRNVSKQSEVRKKISEQTYYQPKTDQRNTVLLNRIEHYNQYLKVQDFHRKYIKNSTEKILKKPSQNVVQSLVSEKDEEAAEVSKVFNHAKTAGIFLGKQADKAQIRKVYQDTAFIKRYLRAGEIFTRDSFTDAGSIFRDIDDLDIIHPEKVTRGDLAMFQHYLKHEDTDMEKLLRIRKETNSRDKNGGKIDYRKLGQRNPLKKRVDRLVQLSEIHAFLEYSRNLDKEETNFFTPAQKAVLQQKGSFFEAHNSAEFMANTALIRQIVKSPSLSAEFSRLDPDGLMDERTIRRLLNGQIPGLKLEKAENGKINSLIRISGNRKKIVLDAKTYHLLRGGLNAILWNQKNYRRVMEKQRALSGRESIKGWTFREVKQELMEDEEFSAMSGYMEHAVSLSAAGVKASVGTGKAASKATGRIAAKSSTVVGNTIVSELHTLGNDVAAEAVRALEEEISGTVREVNEGIMYVKQLPKCMVRKAEKQAVLVAMSGARRLGSQIGAWEKSLAATKAGAAITQNRIYRGMKVIGSKTVHGIRKAGHIVHKTTDAIFCSTGIMVDSVKHWMIKPAVMIIGLIVLLQISFAAVLGGMGGNSVVSVMVFDTPEHFNNPKYTTPEEMGFQQRYEQAQTRFQAQIDGIINGYAKTLNKKGQQISYGVNGANNLEENKNDDYVSGVTMHFDSEKSNNLEDILSCIAVVMQQQQAEYHAEALELLDCFYQSSHTYDYAESLLYGCDSGCETTHYFCNEAKDGYLSTEMKFAPYLVEELLIPNEDQVCEVDRENTEMRFTDYAGCVATGTCFHNSGDEEDNFGRRKPQRTTCSNPEACWNCSHRCSNPECSHDCSRLTLGCGGYWYCGGHEHFGCPDGHDVKTCFGHVNIEMNIQMKTMEEMFALGGVEVNEGKRDTE